MFTFGATFVSSEKSELKDNSPQVAKRQQSITDHAYYIARSFLQRRWFKVSVHIAYSSKPCQMFYDGDTRFQWLSLYTSSVRPSLKLLYRKPDSVTLSSAMLQLLSIARLTVLFFKHLRIKFHLHVAHPLQANDAKYFKNTAPRCIKVTPMLVDRCSPAFRMPPYRARAPEAQHCSSRSYKLSSPAAVAVKREKSSAAGSARSVRACQWSARVARPWHHEAL